MAGHSKWKNIQHRKGAADAKRGALFTKLAKEIMVAAKLGGGDESANPRLRTAVLKARQNSMPKDNIDRAIKKGTGELEGVTYEEGVYEGYGPGGIAIMVEVLTDKKSRTVPELKSTFKTNGGTMAEANAVAYLFDKKGLILVEGDNITEDDVMEIALDAGAEDIEKDDEKVFAVKTAVNDFHAVLAAMEPKLTAKGYKIVESGLKYIPQTTIAVDGEKGKEALELISALEDNDDVQNVYSNLELTESLMA
ncbi:MAG TPA: YebC/PmpR family DNA-binding transcriptional regulator [Turneriella sp.]|nr:YebC/PmpR family DNA-binding transcriptional regulator [Turneriella sp.]HNE19456.1 YebC/PmpR family DNA-binding transcriptional regulator [Turneriella sp.]HNJ64486.1 YebC/PmpR family DNA-binding transcriptional regulator [Turneriella sp.]HNL08997.1 YebC/PmpR family DNA-binding transcriptional regulator [Turneriella sp.]